MTELYERIDPEVKKQLDKMFYLVAGTIIACLTAIAIIVYVILGMPCGR